MSPRDLPTTWAIATNCLSLGVPVVSKAIEAKATQLNRSRDAEGLEDVGNGLEGRGQNQ